MGPENERCVAKFPEILEQFPQDEIRESAESGSYPFHEDTFNVFVQMNRSDPRVLSRAGSYIGELLASENQDDVNLAKIGIIEGLMDKKVSEIIPFLSAEAKEYARGFSHGIEHQ